MHYISAVVQETVQWFTPKCSLNSEDVHFYWPTC